MALTIWFGADQHAEKKPTETLIYLFLNIQYSLHIGSLEVLDKTYPSRKNRKLGIRCAFSTFQLVSAKIVLMQSLERRLGLFSVVTISISSMIGSGIFVLPGIGFEITGPSLYLAFLLSAISIIPAAMSKAELATAMPTSGGTYVYLERTFGPLAGTISGLGLFLSILLKASFSLVGIGAYFAVLSSFPLLPTVLSFVFMIGLLNIFGIGKVSGFLTIVLFITVIGLSSICAFAIPSWDINNLEPLMTNGWKGLASATGLVFVSFAGVTKVAAIAEEVIEPEKNLPRGILLSLFLVTIIYCGTSLILAGSFPNSEIAGDLKPIYSLAKNIGGPLVGSLMAIVAVLTMMNTSNAGVLAGSRFPFAMARDSLLPKWLGAVHGKFLTPYVSIILSMIIIIIVLTTMDVAKIAKLASAFMILIYMLENIAVIVLRESRAQWYKPQYKSPFYPGLQILGIISSIVLLVSMGSLVLYAILAISVPSILIYFIYARKRTDRRGVIGLRKKRTDLIKPVVTNEFEIPVGLTRDAPVVVSLFGKESSPDMLVEMGVAMADDHNVEVVKILEIPEQMASSDFEEPTYVKSLRRRVKAMRQVLEKEIWFDSIVSHDVQKTILEISQRVHCKWLFVEWQGKKGALTFHNPIGWLKSHLHCNLATYRDVGIRYIRKVMAIISDDCNDKLVIDTANHLASVNNAEVTLVKFCNQQLAEEKKNYEKKYLENLFDKFDCKVNAMIICGESPVIAIQAETINYDLLILGGSDFNLVQRFKGSFDDKLMSQAACSVLSVHASSFPLE